MKRNVVFRMDEADITNLQTDAREAGMSVSDYLRALVLHRPSQTHADAHLEARLARIETLALASAVSAYESQLIALAALTPEQTEKAKKHRAAQFAAWRAWGVKAAFLGLDMRPKSHKEHADE